MRCTCASTGVGLKLSHKHHKFNNAIAPMYFIVLETCRRSNVQMTTFKSDLIPIIITVTKSFFDSVIFMQFIIYLKLNLAPWYPASLKRESVHRHIVNRLIQNTDKEGLLCIIRGFTVSMNLFIRSKLVDIFRRSLSETWANANVSQNHATTS